MATYEYTGATLVLADGGGVLCVVGRGVSWTHADRFRLSIERRLPDDTYLAVADAIGFDGDTTLRIFADYGLQTLFPLPGAMQRIMAISPRLRPGAYWLRLFQNETDMGLVGTEAAFRALPVAAAGPVAALRTRFPSPPYQVPHHGY